MKILFIGGSLNQTSMMHKIASQLGEHDCYFTPYYADGFIRWLAKTGALDISILGGRHYADTMCYLAENNLLIDLRGEKHDYDLVITGSDSIIQKNIRNKRLILVQEGMTEPEGLMYHLVRLFKLPRWLANTSVMGLSNAFDAFCVASNGYKRLFIHKGVYPEKMITTGIPNFDNLAEIPNEPFPHEHFVLVATTPFRETMRPEIRPLFIRKCVEIANGRELVFKLHPVENAPRAIKEINTYAPGAKVYWRGNVDNMIKKADAVITQWSTCTFVALALGKELHSDLDIDLLKQIMPIQNGGESAARIADVCRTVIQTPLPILKRKREKLRKQHLKEIFQI